MNALQIGELFYRNFLPPSEAFLLSFRPIKADAELDAALKRLFTLARTSIITGASSKSVIKAYQTHIFEIQFIYFLFIDRAESRESCLEK